MGNMSAPDAAPLPRQGEVFFDVRGEARVLRLSWYADTGVAVFSIWQGGTCTGTFRLPIDELPRMVETLRRGPGGLAAADPGPPTQAVAAPGQPADYRETGYRQAPPPGEQAPPEDGFSSGSRQPSVSQQAARYGGPEGHEHPAAYPGPGGYDDRHYGGYQDPPAGPLPVGRWQADEGQRHEPGRNGPPGHHGGDEEEHYRPGEADPLADYGPERGYRGSHRPGGFGAGPLDDGYSRYQGPEPGQFGSEPLDQAYRADRGYQADPEPGAFGSEPLAYGYGPDDGYRAGHVGGFEPDPLSDGYEAEQGYLPGPMTDTFGALNGGYDLETVGHGRRAGPGSRDYGGETAGRAYRGEVDDEDYGEAPGQGYRGESDDESYRGETTRRRRGGYDPGPPRDAAFPPPAYRDDQPPPSGYRPAGAEAPAREGPREREYRASRGRS
jgi:hypothetical protein